ncbi:MFS transporter [Rhizobium sp. CCGE532]|uniref:MFS transporter n=1 Tax=Rhizobium sp. CCGE532 TaxID=2364272 RepID=UPI001FDF442A|nr:MFS transporter [Rhizobium sp. CCGE532]
MFVLTLVLFVLTKFSSPFLVGWLTFAAITPGLIVSPVAGVLLDRAGPTIAIRIDMIASAVIIAAISGAGWAGWSSGPVLSILVILFSLAGPLGAAGTRTLLPRLVPHHALHLANALDSAVHAIVNVIGPAMAGVLVAWLGPEGAMTMIAAGYAGGAICLSHVRHLPGLGSTQTSLLRQAIEGIQIVARQQTLRGLAISYSLYEITWGIFYVAVPIFAADHYATAASASVVGFLWAAIGIAGSVGALFAGHVRTTGRERRVMAAGMLVTAFAAWPIAAEFGFCGLAIGLMLAGVSSGPISVALLTLRQRRTDSQQLGRVLSISMSLNRVGFPLGSAIGSVVITASTSGTFIVASIASIAAAIAIICIPPDTASTA